MFSAKTSDKAVMPAMPAAPRTNGKTAIPSIISQYLSVTGDLASDGDVQVDGVVDGNVKTCRRLDEAGARAETPTLGRSKEEGDGAYARSAGAALSD